MMKSYDRSFFTEVGKRIKQQRNAKKFTRDEFAVMLGVSSKFVYEIEVGGRGMSVLTLYRISKALEISTDWLLNGDGKS